MRLLEERSPNLSNDLAAYDVDDCVHQGAGSDRGLQAPLHETTRTRFQETVSPTNRKAVLRTPPSPTRCNADWHQPGIITLLVELNLQFDNCADSGLEHSAIGVRNAVQ